MDRWLQLQDIFDAALALPPEQRGDCIRHHCGDDARLEARVKSLLSASQTSEQYLTGLAQQVYPLISQALPQRQTIGHYQLLEQLGEGGMGVVYRAFDSRLQRQIAIKLMNPWHRQDTVARERFYHEARAAAQCSHPNICEVLEFSEDDGQPYIVTPFCEGSDFGELIKQNCLSVGDILDLMLQLTDALDCAHSKGVYHRDLKPSNIIVDNDKKIKLVDFGIAKIAGDDISRTGEIVGSVAYMAPEQFSGAEVDQRTDIWSLGIILFEALAGVRPFAADTPANVMYQLFHSTVPALPDPGLPMAETFERIIRRCLRVDRQQRYASTLLLAQDINRLQQLAARDWHAIVPRYRGAGAEVTAPISSGYREYRRVCGFAVAFDPKSAHAPYAARVRHYGGVVMEQKSAGQLFAYFGYPQLSEGAADSALACSLEILCQNNSSGQALDTAEKLALASVPLVISRSPDDSEVRPTGDLRAALEPLVAVASPGSLLLAESINRRLRSLLPDSLRRADIVHQGDACYQLFSAPAPDGLTRHKTAFVGRHHELGLLTSAWEQTREGSGRTLLLSGEAGIGKSRLLHELKRTIRQPEDGVIIELGGDPNQRATPLHPVSQGLRRWLQQQIPGSEESDALGLCLDNLEVDRAQHLPYLAWLLGLEHPLSATLTRHHSAEALRQAALRSVERLLRSTLERAPLLLIIEDLHWADRASLEWLDSLPGGTLPENLLLVVTARPELFQQWRAFSDATHLVLRKLASKEAREMIACLDAQAVTAAETQDQIVAKTNGNPLFVEEYTRMLLQGSAGRKTLADSPVVPDSLQDILLARLDQIGAAKVTAQAASVAGGTFSGSMLAPLVGDSEALLASRLDSLAEADIIYRGGGSDTYCFKHALIRDALYASLDPDSRETLHLQLAEYLEAAANDKQPAGHPGEERIARHLSKARAWHRAARWWQRGARRAQASFAMEDAITLCRLGLRDLEHCEEDHTRGALELALQVSLGPALMAVKGYAASEVATVYHRVLELCDQLQDRRQQLPALFGLWTFHCVRAQHAMAASLAQRMVTLAEDHDDQDYRVQAYLARGITRFFQGDGLGADTDHARVVDCFDTSMQASHIQAYGQDSLMVALSYQSWVALEARQTQRARHLSDAALDTARRSGHPFTLSYGLAFAGWLHTGLGNHGYAKQLLEENLLLAEQQGFKLFYALSQVFRDILALRAGDAAGPQVIGASLDHYAATGARLFMPHFLAARGEAALQAGDLGAAAAGCEQALARIKLSGERWSLKDVKRLETAIQSREYSPGRTSETGD